MPGHITGSFVHRASGTAGIALMNTSAAPSPAALATDLAIKVLDDDPILPPAWTPGTTVPDELTGVLGTWFTEGSPFVFSVREGRLEAKSPAAADYTAPAVFEKLSPDVYRTVSGRETGELLRITRDPSGTPTKLNWATYLCTREPLAFGQHL
jgi:hypothetical protein